MEVNRHIAALLLVCFSVFLGHNLVPHHHHSEVVSSPIANECPLDHSDQHGQEHPVDPGTDAEKHSTHCHAFNDLVFEKYNTPTIRPWISGIPAMLVPGKPALPEENQKPALQTYTVLKTPCRTALYLGSRDLRAPPLLA